MKNCLLKNVQVVLYILYISVKRDIQTLTRIIYNTLMHVLIAGLLKSSTD